MMKRNKPADNRQTENQQLVRMTPFQLQVLSILVRRANLAYLAGTQTYGGARDMNEALGYPTTIEYSDYLGRYYRQDMAKAIIDRPVSASWRGPVLLLESSEKEDTPLEKGWIELDKELKLKPKFIQLDKLASIGQYAVLLMGVSDVKKQEDFVKPLTSKKLKLSYIKAYGEEQAKVLTYEDNVNSPRYGLPTTYNITTTNAGGEKSITTVVHHTRVLHVAYDTLESEIEGAPALEAVFNRLIDLEKIVGGDGEMFWRGARPGIVGKADEKHIMTTKMINDLMDQLDEFDHNMRRALISEGADITALAQQISDPSAHVDVQIQMISAVTGIPKRILTGSERGELASSLDADEWRSYVLSRREECVEPFIIRPFVDFCTKYGILPEAGEEGYSVKWAELFSLSEKDKAEIGKTRSLALQAYLASPMAEAVISPEGFMEFFLGLSEEQIELLGEMRKSPIAEEMQAIRGIEEEQKRIEEEARLKEIGKGAAGGEVTDEDDVDEELKRTK